MQVDVEAVSRLIREVAATEVLPRFRDLAAHESWEKRPGSVVTVADERAEERLAAGLTAILPGSSVVGEEAAEADPEILASLGRSGPVWLVDPVDGTANFAAGEPRFAVMVALVVGGETAAGWILDPTGGAMATAERGAGAWLDGARLRVADEAPEDEMIGAVGARLRRDKGFSGRFAGVTHNRCCGFDYLALGRGTTHFAFYRGLKPWDHAPGQLIHAEAGGYGACLEGGPYRPGREGQRGLLMAPGEASWHALAGLIREALETGGATV